MVWKYCYFWYDYLCKQASNDIVMFLHADMYVTPKLDEEILKQAQIQNKGQRTVS